MQNSRAAISLSMDTSLIPSVILFLLLHADSMHCEEVECNHFICLHFKSRCSTPFSRIERFRRLQSLSTGVYEPRKANRSRIFCSLSCVIDTFQLFRVRVVDNALKTKTKLPSRCRPWLKNVCGFGLLVQRLWKS